MKIIFVHAKNYLIFTHFQIFCILAVLINNKTLKKINIINYTKQSNNKISITKDEEKENIHHFLYLG